MAFVSSQGNVRDRVRAEVIHKIWGKKELVKKKWKRQLSSNATAGVSMSPAELQHPQPPLLTAFLEKTFSGAREVVFYISRRGHYLRGVRWPVAGYGNGGWLSCHLVSHGWAGVETPTHR